MEFKMKFPITNLFITNEINRQKIKAPIREFTVVHDTGNKNSTARNNYNYMNRPYKIVKGKRYEADGKTDFRVASAHTFTDDKEILVIVPLDEKAWHVLYDVPVDNKLFGDDANDAAVGHELCYFDDIARTKKAYEKFVWLNAYTAHLYGWQDIKRRFVGHDFLDPKRKTDPMNAFKLIGKSYDDFLNDVVSEYVDCTAELNVTPKLEHGKIYKERVYATNGKLVHCEGNYKVPASDVRFVRFQTGKTRYQFVYEKNAKVSDLVKKHKASFGINAPYFYNGLPLGDSEDNDKVISAAYGKMLKWHEFAVVDGKPIIGQLNKSDKQELLIQSAPLLIENGVFVYEKYRVLEEVQDDIGKSRCQRTFAWTDKYGDLYIGIADGRTSSDQGLNLEEMALFAMSKNALWAISFDGGGSTILCDQTGGINQKLNTGVNERATSHALLFYINESDEESENTDMSDGKITPVEIDLISGDKKETVRGLVQDGVSYVELRKVGSFLGAKVGYDSVAKKPSLTK
jgi:hypothetical protein